jgi:uncharacterized protein (DUF927 family)
MSSTTKRGFVPELDGLYFYPGVKKDKKGVEQESDAIRICAPLGVLALAVDEDDRWGKLLEWQDPKEEVVSWVMADRLLEKRDELFQTLRDRGLDIEPSGEAHAYLCIYLSTQKPVRFINVVDHLGWWEKDGKLSYVLPDRVLGAPSDVVFSGNKKAYTVLGSLQQWQTHVSKKCIGNSRLAFCVSLAFAAPLLYLMNEQSGGINLWGLSQKGKTTALDVALSVAGVEKKTWRTTDNSLESLCEERTDGLLGLDEMAQVDPHAAGRIAYMVANGFGKGRSDQSGNSRKVKHWRTLLLSTGEIKLADKMAEIGERTRGGQEVRLVDVPSDAGAGMGVFEHLHGAKSPGEFSDQLRLASVTYSGTAYLRYLESLIAILAEEPKLPALLRQQRDDFIARNVPDGASGQVRSVCGRFAVIAIAGEIATDLDITGWPPGEATTAAETCFRAWLGQRGSNGDRDIEQGVRQVIAFIEKHGTSRFQTIGDGDGEFAVMGYAGRAGYRRKTVNQKTAEVSWQYYVLPNAWEEVTAGYNAEAVAKELAKRGLLVRGDKTRLTTKVTTPDGRVQVYCIKGAILAGDDV